jgi:hypothetical protein
VSIWSIKHPLLGLCAKEWARAKFELLFFERPCTIIEEKDIESVFQVDCWLKSNGREENF